MLALGYNAMKAYIWQITILYYMSYAEPKVEISADKDRLDIDMIHGYLTDSYWGKGRTREQVEKSIAHTTSFGVYLDGKQIGFARVLTDTVVFAYVMDVFVLEEYRGRGYAKQLMAFILGFEQFNNVGKWFLATKDAHGLYSQFGFNPVLRPDWYMEIISPRAVKAD